MTPDLRDAVADRADVIKDVDSGEGFQDNRRTAGRANPRRDVREGERPADAAGGVAGRVVVGGGDFGAVDFGLRPAGEAERERVGVSGGKAADLIERVVNSEGIPKLA